MTVEFLSNVIVQTLLWVKAILFLHWVGIVIATVIGMVLYFFVSYFLECLNLINRSMD